MSSVVGEMKLRRPIGALLVVAVAALVAAFPATAKEGVKATLTTKIPLDAKPGTELKVAWTLASVDENGHRQPFGAGGVFVRLLSATGAHPETAFTRGSGTFTATVAVPEGGIGDVQIGIRGRTTFGTSNLVFLITNDPLPGPARVTSPAQGDGGSTSWVFAVVAGALAMCVLAVVFARRKQTRKATDARPIPQRR